MGDPKAAALGPRHGDKAAEGHTHLMDMRAAMKKVLSPSSETIIIAMPAMKACVKDVAFARERRGWVGQWGRQRAVSAEGGKESREERRGKGERGAYSVCVCV